MSIFVSRRAAALTLAAACAAFAAGCGGGNKEEQQAPAAATAAVATPIDPATAGMITGTITLQGTPPAATPIKTASDPNCKDPVQPESYIVGRGGTLQNVFVYVKDGLGNRVFPVPTEPVILEQRGCTYRPHVLGVQAGQPVRMLNSDATLHNIHAVPEANQEFNMGQPTQGAQQDHVFSTKEVLVPFTCDVHKWMSAFVGVVDNPFYAVTTADGGFSLKGLPPGTYTVEAVHEKLGRQTQSVTIGPSETRDLAFTFTI
jgi:plastocyanin